MKHFKDFGSNDLISKNQMDKQAKSNGKQAKINGNSSKIRIKAFTSYLPQWHMFKHFVQFKWRSKCIKFYSCFYFSVGRWDKATTLPGRSEGKRTMSCYLLLLNFLLSKPVSPIYGLCFSYLRLLDQENNIKETK